MVRDGDRISSGVTALSSIALLQERFKQLEKMKELRQEKELLRILSESERFSPPTIHNNYEMHSKKFSSGSSEVTVFVNPPKPHCQLSLSLWPDINSKYMNKHADSRGTIQAPSNRTKTCFTDAPRDCTSSIDLDQNSGADIDTSLRL